MEPEAARKRCDHRGQDAGTLSGVLGRVLRDERPPDERASHIAERLGREELARRLHERERRPLVSAVEGEARQDLAAEVRGTDSVSGEAEAVVDASTAAEDRKVGGGDVDRAAPGVRVLPPPQLRKEADEALARPRDDARIDLEPGLTSPAETHRAAAPAERDAVVPRRSQVVDESSAVDDRLAAGPAEVGEHVGDGFRQHDVAGGGRPREPVTRGPEGRGVDGQHGCSRADATRTSLDSALPMKTRHLGALVDADAAPEEPRPEAEREPCRLDGRVQPVDRSAEEEWGVTAQ